MCVDMRVRRVSKTCVYDMCMHTCADVCRGVCGDMYEGMGSMRRSNEVCEKAAIAWRDDGTVDGHGRQPRCCWFCRLYDSRAATSTHISIHTSTHTSIHTSTHTSIYTSTHTSIYTSTNNSHAREHGRTDGRTDARTDARTHARARTHVKKARSRHCRGGLNAARTCTASSLYGLNLG